MSQVGRLGDASSPTLARRLARARTADDLPTWTTAGGPGRGDFWSYMLVAEGAVDIATEPDLAVHDMAALVPIVQEAGGRFTGLDGRRVLSGNAVATNGLLHDRGAAPARHAGPGREA